MSKLQIRQVLIDGLARWVGDASGSLSIHSVGIVLEFQCEMQRVYVVRRGADPLLHRCFVRRQKGLVQAFGSFPCACLLHPALAAGKGLQLSVQRL